MSFLLQKKIVRLTAVTLTIAILQLFTSHVSAQLSITSTSAFTQNFNGMGSSATASCPTGWKVGAATYAGAASAVTAAAGTTGSGALTSSSTGASYNFADGITASSTDRSLGNLTTGGYASPKYVHLQVTNNTGGTVSGFTITFDYEKYRAGTRAFSMAFESGTDGSTFGSTWSDGAHSYAADGANAVVNPPTTVSKSVTITGLTLANGSSYYLRWALIGSGGSTNGQGIGIDNFSITATPACSTPTAYSVTGTGSYCAGGTGVAVGLANSQSGVSYQLYNGAATVGSPVAGTGSAISFGNQTTAATYTVLATVGTCTASMTGSAIVSVNSLPTISFTPTSPSFCEGSIGVDVSASGASTYTWSPATGLSATTGATVTANPSATTTYTVTGTSASGCVGSGTVIVTENPLPTPTISGTTTISSGGSAILTFAGVAGDVVYYWNGASTVSTTISGDGTSTVSVSPVTTTVYSVTSATSAAGCNQPTIVGETATVTVSTTPTAFISGTTTICPGASTTLSFSGTAGATVYYNAGTASPLSVTLSGSTGTGTATATVSPATTTTYTLDSIVSGVYHGPLSGSVTISVSSLPTVFSLTGVGSYCSGGAGSAIGLSNSQLGVDYQLYNGSSTVGSPVAGTGSAISFGSFTTASTYTAVATNAFGCSSNMSGGAVVSVNPLPTAYTLTGTGSYCTGGAGVEIGLSNSDAGINYQLYNGASTVGSPIAGTGSAISFGSFTTASTYTVLATNTTTSCTAAMTGSAIVTITSLPEAGTITGTATLAFGSTTALSISGGLAGGTWSSSNTSIATVGTSGVVSGLTGGTSIITYSVTNSCGSDIATITVTVSGPVAVIMSCQSGLSYTEDFSDIASWANGFSSGTGANRWWPVGVIGSASIPDATKTTVSSATFSTGTSGGVQRGTSALIFLTTGATDNTSALAADFFMNFTGVNAGNITFDAAQLANSTGNRFGTLRLYYSTNGTTFTELTGTDLPFVASNNVASSATISVALPAAFNNSPTARLRFYYHNGSGGTTGSRPKITVDNLNITATNTVAPITGTMSLCAESTTTLSSATSGGTWSSGSTSVATIGTSGIVSGITAGTSVITYTVTNATGCSTFVTSIVTVNPLPIVPSITGTFSVCESLTTTLSNTTSGGIWTSSNTSIATIGTSGIVTGVAAGTSNISYVVTNGSGCITTVNAVVTVNALPTVAAITGTLSVCESATTTLANATSDGVWSSSATSVATVGTSGIVSAVSAGTSTIAYSVTNVFGCVSEVYAVVTVNPLPTVAAISGASALCAGGSTSYINATSDGVWVSSNTSVATIGTSGSLSAISAGTTLVSYTVTNGFGCATTVTTSVTVRPTPTAAPTNNGYICVGGTVTLTANPANGANTYTWSGSSLSATTTENPTATPTATTVYSLTVSDGTSDAGCAPSTVYTTSVTVNATPTAAPTNSGPICNGGTVNLTANGAGGATTYSWSGSSLSSSVVANSTATPTVTTVYSLTVTDGSTQPGCTPATVYTTSVTVNTTPTAAPTNSGPICNGGTVTLTANPGGSTATYAWSGPSLSSTTVANPTATPSVTSVYSLTVTNGMSDAGCTPTTVYTTTVTVRPTPTAAPTNNGYICVGGTVTLTANPANGANTYTWSGSSLSATTSENPTATPTATTVYSLTVSDGTSDAGCAPSTVYTTSVTVNATPTAAPTNSGPICNGGTVTLTANGAGGATTYSWSGSSLSSSVVANPTATPTVTSVYSLTVTDGSTQPGCSPATVYTTSVTVNTTPTAAPTNSGPICNGGTVTLTANPGGSTATYSWSGPSLSSTTVANPTATPSVTSVYSLTVTNGTAEAGCTPTTVYTTTVTVRPTPTAAPTNNGYICVGGTVTLTANPASGANTYTWSGSSLSATTSENPTATPTSTTVYSLTVSDGTADAGCSPATVYTTSVTVNATPTAGPTNSGPICNGGTVTLTANAAGGATTYNWSGSSLSSVAIANPTATPTVTSVYSLTVTDGSSQPGCAPATVYTTSVTVNTTPTAAPTNSGPICNGGTVTLTANPGGSTATYAWSGPSLSSTTVANPTATPSVTSVYSLTVTNGTADAGCTPTTVYTTSVTVRPTPTAAPTNNGYICVGGTVTLTANPANGANTYIWSGSSLSATTTDNPTATPTSSTVYSLTVSDGTADAGCSPATVYTTSVTVNATPTAAPTNSGPICNGGTVTLTANGADGATTYIWSGSSLSSSAIANPTATPTVTSVYSLTVTDGSSQPGCSPATVYTTSVSVNTTPTAAPTNSGPICNGGTVTLTANPGGSTATYSWSGLSLSSTTVANPTATPSVTSVYSLTVTNGTSDAGCTPTTVYTTTVTVRPTPTAAPTNNGYICVGGTVTLTANPANGANTYTWSGSSLSATTSENPTATPTATTVYSLTVSDGTSDAGCSPATVYTTSVTVNATPTAAPTNSGPICNGGTVTLTANGAGGATTYSWSGSSLSSSVVAAPTATPTVTSVYSLTVTDGSTQPGCAPATVYTTSVTVNTTPTAAPTNSGPICNGGTVTLTANPGGSTATYSWSGPSLSSTTVANPTATPSVTSVYSLTVTNGTADAGCTPTTVYTTSVTVRPTPTAAPTNNGYICVGGTVTLTANPASGANTYAWVGSSLSATTSENPTATPTSTTVYSLTVSDGTSDAGCSPSTVYTTSVTVNATPTAAPTNSGPICNGGTVTLTANAAGGASTYNWSGSSLSSSVVANPTATPTVTSVYSLTVTDGSTQPGCTPATVYTTSVTVNATPTATPTNSGPICNGGTVTLTANPGGSTATYAWSGPSLSSTTVANPTATPSVTSVYSLTVTNGTSDAGCTPTTVYTTTVTVRPTPTAAPTNNGYICVGGTVTLTANPANGANTYTWVGSSLSATTSENPTATPTSTTVYSLTVSDGTSDAGCAPATVYTTSVTVNATPTAAPTNSGPICNGGTVTLTANGAGGASTYNWSGSSLSSSAIANPTATPTVTSVYSLTVTDGSSQPGCTPATVYTTSVTVNTTPTAAPTNSGPICNGGTVTLTANPGGSTTTYSWSGLSLSASTVANPTATPSVTSVYSLTVTNGTADAGCTPTTVYTTSVTVRPTPTAAPTNNGYICVGGTVTLAANPANGANTYTWSGSSLSATTTENPTATPTATTVYSLTVSDGTSDAGCAPATVYTTSVTVNSTPTAAPTNSGSICNGGTVTLTANGAGGASTYNWSGSSLSSSAIANPTATPTVTSVYSLTVTDGSSQPGCAPATVYTTSVTVNTTPTATPTNSGPICNGGTVTLTANPGGSTATYSWSGPSLSSTTVANPTATPSVTSVYSLTVTNGTADAGCTPTTVYTTSVTVNPLPVVPSITGTFTVCEGATTTLANTTTGGVWSSSATSVATIGSTGIVTALTAGNTNITYSVTNGFGCNTEVSTTITVNPVPVVAAIAGTTTICETATTNLSSVTTGGVWSSSNTSIATVGTSGTVTGVTAGNAAISYTVTNGFGCSTTVTSIVTVNPLPTVISITGPTNVCVGSTIPYSTITTGGVWSSSDAAVASVGTGGIVSGVSAGTANITYSVTNGFGCTTISVATITVNPLPVVSAITGTTTMCVAGTTMLSSTTSSGVWSSGTTSVATIGTSGLVTGVTAGTSIITYSVTTAFGCNTQVYTEVTVNPLPTISAITGTASLCRFDSVTLASATTGGVWSALSTSIATVSATGVVTGVAAGTTIITYTVTNEFGCSSYVVRTVTVNPLPTVASISGTPTLCEGATRVLSSATTGGVWTSSNTTVATVGTSGTVSGLAAGTTNISYTVTNGFGCATVVLVEVTVNPLPIVPSITGTLILCANTTTTLSNTSTGGVWVSSNVSAATVNSSGVVTGVSSGTSTISYTVTNSFGCVTRVTSVVTVNPVPVVSGITGVTSVCANASATLSSATTGGEWSSSNTSVATIGTGGVVSGVAAGTTIITYAVTNGFGCTSQVTRIFTVNAIPTVNAITGTLSLCQGTTTALANTTTGGAWTSGNTSVATIASSGVVTAISSGTATITYSVTNGFSCINTSTAVVTVNPLPVVNPITGTLVVCRYDNTTLSSTTASGVWSSSNMAVGTIASSGIFTALTAGTTTVSYTITDGLGCSSRATSIVTVNPTPSVAAISGSLNICEGSNGTLTNSVSGGTWVSSNTAVATIGTTGVVAAITPGTTTISYTVTNGFGCSTTVTTNVTINPLPTVATISGTATLCAGTTTSLTNTTSGGTWVSSTSSVATINTTGTVTGIAAGTTVITYTVTSSFGCVTSVATVVTVNPAPVVAAITGIRNICENATTLLSSTTSGGVWSSTNTTVATVGSAGMVTSTLAGTSTISYSITNGFGCVTAATAVVTVNPLPIVSAITGTFQVCQAATTSLANTTTGGVWSSSSTAVANVTSTGVVTGVAAGTATISYSVSSAFSCTTIVTTTVTVNPLPVVGAISGPSGVCRDASVTFSDTTSGGVWISNNSSIAMVSSAGVVTGVNAGNTTITYTVTNSFGCSARALKLINVFALPVITSTTGSYVLCEGSSRTLASSLSGGIWSSASPVNAAVTASTGIVSGLLAGTAMISVQITSTGCVDTAIVTINPRPVISGINFVCAGNVTQLNTSISGGTWSSSNPARATVNPTTGFVNGVSVGTANITYTIPTGCFSVVQVTVNTAVPNITGPASVCLGETATLLHPVSGGTWVSSNLTNATISTTGIVSGLSVGTTTISYLLEEGCYATRTTSVSALPNPIAGNGNLCVGAASNLTNSVIGTWSSSNPSVASITGSGYTTGNSLGNAVISFRATATGCRVTREVTVNPLPAPITGASVFCPATTINLASATTGGVWSSFNPSVVSVDSTSGVATANVINYSSISVTTIRYTLPTGCLRSAIVTVNPTPAPIYGGSQNLCLGETTAMLTSIASGTWSSSVPAIASVSTTGVVTANTAGNSTISYTNSFGCFSTRTVTVNGVLADNSGTLNLCSGQTTVLTNTTTGGTWSSANNSVASINSSTGLMAGIGAGTTTISYRIGSSCYSVSVVTVNSTAAPITGTTSVCVGTSTDLNYAVTGGTWSSTNTAVATVDTTGLVSGVSTGTATISYIFGAGCFKTVTVTVQTLPAPISGTPIVCAGATTSLTATGGTWSSGNTTVATINASGTLSGVSGGTATISYRNSSNGCYVTVIATVNALPVIATTTPLCPGTTTTLTATPTGGTWYSTSTAIAVDSTSGIVTAVAISYSGPSITAVNYISLNGCSAMRLMTVNPIPAPLYGSTGTVCVGGTSTFLSSTTGGTWSTANTAIAAIVTGGTISGVAAGTTLISYANAYGCANTATVTVYPVPGANIGTTEVCAGQSTILSNSTGTGTWSTTNYSIVSVNATTGLVNGINAGTATVTYRINPTCTSVSIITVTPGVSAIGGPNALCVGTSLNYTNAAAGGTWVSSNTAVATISTTGMVTAVGLGTTTLTYTTSLCSTTKVVSVNCTARPVEEVNEVSVVTIYPNPVTGNMFSIQTTDTGTLTVMAVDGKLIGQYTVPVGTTPLSLTEAAVSGVYMARFTDLNGKVTNFRLVVNR